MTDYSSVGDFLLKEGCLAFTAVMFEAVNKQPFRIAPHHRIICHKLDQVLRGEHPTNRLMFNIPPRHSVFLCDRICHQSAFLVHASFE